MSLVEKLLAADADIKKSTKRIKSERLTKMIGADAYITIQEVSGRGFSQAKALSKGAPDPDFEANLIFAVKSIVDPDLKDEKLMERFGAATPKDLCEKLFEGEVYKIAEEVIGLSGISASEDDVKN